MKLKNVIAVALVAGVVAGSFGAAEAAKKKKLVSAKQTYFMRWEGNGTECGANYLSVKDGEDTGNSCEFTALAAQEVLTASGQGSLARDWTASDGVPFVLDAKKAIVGDVYITGPAGATSVAGKLEVTLTGMTGGRSQDLGSTTVDIAPTPAGEAQVHFEVKAPKKFDKKKFTSFNVNLVQRGVNVLTWQELEDPASNIVLGIYKKK